MTILVVDDSIDLRQLVAAILKSRGFLVRTAENGQVALESLNREPTDAVVLDLDMPVMNGLSFLQAVREDPRWNDLPIVVFSAFGDGQIKPELIRLGVREVLLKGAAPPSEIALTVGRHLRGQAEESTKTVN